MKKILIADDDPNIIKLLYAVLIQNNFNVISAKNGVDALSKIKSEKPDLVILDIMMPGLDGFHIAFELKIADDYDIPDNTKYIILTARSEKRDIELGKKLGATAYITKPFEVEELIKVINNILT